MGDVDQIKNISPETLLTIGARLERGHGRHEVRFPLFSQPRQRQTSRSSTSLGKWRWAWQVTCRVKCHLPSWQILTNLITWHSKFRGHLEFTGYVLRTYIYMPEHFIDPASDFSQWDGRTSVFDAPSTFHIYWRFVLFQLPSSPLFPDLVMGLTISSVFSRLFGKKQMRILMG